jgi:hypothetical protein
MKKYLLVSVFGALAVSWQTNLFAAPYVRYEVHSLQGKKAVVSMQKALVKLRLLGCDKPVSWYYQGAIHGVPLPGIDGNLSSNPLCPSFTSTSKLRSTWAKCGSHNESGPPSDIHFLPWHRLYIAHFEKIIRKYSADPNFALPYWDYAKFPTLPDRFQARAKGSLYEQARAPSLNKGQPIGVGALATIHEESTALNDVVDYETYNSQIQRGLHDFLHDYIGGTATTYNKVYNQIVSAGLMGNVPSAAFDPIFWVHHANIDRLWQQWIAENPGQNVTVEQLNSNRWPYRFFQNNGAPVNYTMTQVINAIKAPDYIYDNQTAPATSAKAEPKRLVEHAIVSIPLDAVATSANPADVTLNLAHEKLLVVDKTTNERIVLKLNVAYTGKPKGRYEVYVNLPEHVATTSTAAKDYFAGAISFFVNDREGKGGEKEFRYDITNELATSKQAMRAMRLTVVKTSGFPEGSVTVKNAKVLYLN